ncbi:PC3-like endoprotease variant B, partial [Mustelus asterias]
PSLTWRDVQHLIVRTAKISDLLNKGWKINGAGYHVHHKYGFGLLDAGRMLKAALKWKNLGPQKKCVVNYGAHLTKAIPARGSLKLNLTTNACMGTANAIDTLEHVQVTVTVSSICRGDLEISLTSPYGTKSKLLAVRLADESQAGLKDWTFMTVHLWGENPEGVWILTIADRANTVTACERSGDETTAGSITKYKITLWGTYRHEVPKREEELGSAQNGKNNQKLENIRNLVEKKHIDGQIAKDFINEYAKKVEAKDIPLKSSGAKLPANVKSTNAPSSNFGEVMLRFWYSQQNRTKNNVEDTRSWTAVKNDVRDADEAEAEY